MAWLVLALTVVWSACVLYVGTHLDGWRDLGILAALIVVGFIVALYASVGIVELLPGHVG